MAKSKRSTEPLYFVVSAFHRSVLSNLIKPQDYERVYFIRNIEHLKDCLSSRGGKGQDVASLIRVRLQSVETGVTQGWHKHNFIGWHTFLFIYIHLFLFFIYLYYCYYHCYHIIIFFLKNVSWDSPHHFSGFLEIAYTWMVLRQICR